jgi:hypothetical protein
LAVEKLDDNQILQVLEEIPSDCESLASDTESESDDELEEEVQGENISELHENVPVMQVEDEDTSVVEEVAAEDEAGEERKNIVWLKEVLTQYINEFHGDPGPNIFLRKKILLKYSAVCLKMNYLNTLFIIQICMLLRN